MQSRGSLGKWAPDLLNGRIRDLASAVADGGAIDWAAVRAARGGVGPLVENMRILDRIASASQSKRVRGDESRRVRLSGTLAPWEGVLLFVALLRSTLAILGALWVFPATGRELHFAQLGVAATCVLGGLILMKVYANSGLPV